MTISFIVAVAKNRVIGSNESLPWHIPVDMKRFRAITRGHVVIMGRKSYDALDEPLPNRENVVITRQKDLKIPGVKVVRSLEEALAPYRSTDQEVFIIGGGHIFTEALPVVDKMYITHIEKDYEGDAYFPVVDYSLFVKTFEESHTDPVPFRFVDYKRKV